MKTTPETVVLVNCACADIQKLARKVRDNHVYTMVMPVITPLERLMAESPVGIIFAGDGEESAIAAAAAPFAAAGVPSMVLPNVADDPETAADKA